MMDWRAIQFAVTGTRVVELTVEERMMVMRRVAARLLSPKDPHLYPPPGKITSAQMARRFGVDVRTVERLKSELPPAVDRRCPVCGSQTWVLDTGVVEPHPDSLMDECPLSGWVLDDLDQHDLLALSVQWLAGWLRRGDGHGVNSHWEALTDEQKRVLFLATLAAVPEGDAAELFAWTTAAAS